MLFALSCLLSSLSLLTRVVESCRVITVLERADNMSDETPIDRRQSISATVADRSPWPSSADRSKVEIIGADRSQIEIVGADRSTPINQRIIAPIADRSAPVNRHQIAPIDRQSRSLAPIDCRSSAASSADRSTPIDRRWSNANRSTHHSAEPPIVTN